MAKNMNLIGSRFTKISSERKPDFSGKLSINQNIKVLAIESAEDKKDAINVSYSYEVDYADLGFVEIRGNLYIKTDSKTAKTLIKSVKEREFNTPEHLAISNIVIQKASVKAFEVEEEVGLPIHIRLPVLGSKKE